jgi:RimJ/RimL family protein N-acetyltransferase
MSFNDQPVLEGETLRLRPLAADDFEALHKAASDPAIWAGHPAKERWKVEMFRPYFDFLLKAGGTLVVISRDEDRIVGCSRYYESADAPGDIGIGFTFLECSQWGGDTNFEMKNLMLSHAFQSFERVWFHIDPSNIRSQKATVKLGAVFAHDAMLDIVGNGAPVAWKCYCLTGEAWAKTIDARG